MSADRPDKGRRSTSLRITDLAKLAFVSTLPRKALPFLAVEMPAVVTALFALTLFCSALLLFLVQPLLGKLLVPLVGGAPAVWNTCLVFFQAALLVGYLHVHRLSSRLSLRAQAGWHLLILLLPLLAFLAGWLLDGSPLPVLSSLLPHDQDNPVLSLLTLLFLAVGLPFMVLSTTAPLLQRWYGALGSGSRDPYFLYAASNAGSLLGLFSYPLLVEPHWTLSIQRTFWATGVVGCLLLIGLCALVTLRAAPPPLEESAEPSEPLPRRRILRWLALAALPSALLSSGTVHLTTDIAPVPLLWVVPLGLYLLSFILVFAWWPIWLHHLVGRLVPTLLVVIVFLLAFGATEPLEIVASLHLLVLFALCLLCHGELALDRPGKQQLTAFYLWLAVGGVCGSLFCALIAPLLFARLGLVEYPLALVLAALIRPGNGPEARVWPVRLPDVLLPALLCVLAACLILFMPSLLGAAPADDAPTHLQYRLLRGGLLYGLPATLAYILSQRPIRYALALAAVLLASQLDSSRHGTVLYTTRNFFGTLQVTRSQDQFHLLVHGTTQHGQERIEDHCPPEPLMYYYPTGPAGRLLSSLPEGRVRTVGLVGLGCGALASYARPGQKWTFYEIDPAVVRIARDTRWFHFLACCPGEVEVVLGDARRQLQKARPGSFDVLVLDAFSSDAIPTHLLTREALELYLDRLAPGGLLLFHVSNRYLDLDPLLARVADSIDPSLIVRVDHDLPTGDERERGKARSTWVIMARKAQDLQGLASGPRWQPVPVLPGPVWTDDFSNLLKVWKKEE